MEGVTKKKFLKYVVTSKSEAKHAILNIIDLNKTNGVDRNSLPWLFK